MTTTSSAIKDSLKYLGLEQIPNYLRFNHRIIRGHRVGYTLKSLVKSLFEWHNETINTWTHLIGTLVIFTLILSSNLFTQHYHSKHQILRFGETVEGLRLDISNDFKNLTSIDFTIMQRTEEVGLSFTSSLSKIEKEINILLKLTEQDNLIYRETIASHLNLLTATKQKIEDIILGFSFEREAEFLESSILEFRHGVESLQDQINQYLLEIIGLIEKLAEKINPIPKWPLLVFLVSASLCLTFSSIYHLFYPHSEKIYKILRKLDFSGVVLLIVGSSFPLFTYGASCVNYLATTYLCIMCSIGLAVFGLLVSGYFDPKERQKQKSILFGLFGVSFVIPMTHMLILQQIGDIQDTLIFSQFAQRVLIFGGIYLLGLLIYTIQCPERYIAGKFDYCGASHQIWHLLVLLALYITYELNWDLYYERRMHPCPL